MPIELDRVTAINPPDEQPVKLNGRINVGFNKASGNTDLKNTHIDAEFLARTVSHRVTLGGAYNRASEDNHKTEDNAMGHLKHDYFLTRAFYWYLSGLAERDRFKDLSLRATIGPGVGYQFFEGELMNLSVEAGPSYVYTNYDGGGKDDSMSGRWGVKFDRFFFEKLFQYYFSNEGYVSVSDSSNVFMFTRTGLRFPIRGGLSLNSGFEWDWDNIRPRTPTNPTTVTSCPSAMGSETEKAGRLQHAATCRPLRVEMGEASDEGPGAPLHPACAGKSHLANGSVSLSGDASTRCRFSSIFA